MTRPACTEVPELKPLLDPPEPHPARPCEVEQAFKALTAVLDAWPQGRWMEEWLHRGTDEQRTRAWLQVVAGEMHAVLGHQLARGRELWVEP